MTDTPPVDVIVIGAGVSGLACAAALAGKNVLLLERERRHGGRVRTVDLGGQRVDLGACLAFDPTLLPAGWAVDGGRLVPERAMMALGDAQRLVAAATPRGGLVRLGVDAATLDAIDAVARLSADAAVIQTPLARAWLDALLHQVHPGRLQDYALRHQRDGLLTWHPDHWEGGNGALADALLARSGARLMTDAVVTRVTARERHVDVDLVQAGASLRLASRAVVLATTADVAASLFDWPDPATRAFLAATRYAGYLVVALAGRATPQLADFRSLVRLAGSPALVVQQRSSGRDRAVLLCCHCGRDFDDKVSRPDADLIQDCRARLAAWGLDAAALNALDEAAVQRWPQGGTVLSDAYLSARARLAGADGAAVVLAGDYAVGPDHAGYGLGDALRSGLRAADRVRALLDR